MPEAPTVPNMVAQSMGRILRDSTHTKYTVQDKIQQKQSHAHSNTTITWLSKMLLHSKMKGKVTYRTSSKF